MWRNHLPILLALVTLSLASCASVYRPPEHQGLDTDLQSLVGHYADQGRRVALGLGYIDAQGISHSAVAGYRDDERSSPVEIGDVFEIGSVSKMFIATVILQMDAEGLLSLDDTLKDHGVVVPQGEVITLRMLLNHSARIPDYFSHSEFLDEDEDFLASRTTDELIALGLDAEPKRGRDWGYSNTHYVLLAQVITGIEGLPAEDEIWRRILAPLGMNQTFYAASEPVWGDVALGYRDTGREGLWDAWNGMNPSNYSYAGAYVSSLSDMTLFLEALSEGRILDPASLSAMTEFRPTTDRFSYGLGILSWEFAGRTFWGHGGNTLGTQFHAYFHPESHEILMYYSTLGNDDLRGFEKALEHLLEYYGETP